MRDITWTTIRINVDNYVICASTYSCCTCTDTHIGTLESVDMTVIKL